jgi:superfamily II DNA or RNA helicase
MSDIVVTIKDDVFLRVECEVGLSHELSDFFTFEVPGAKFMPAYRSRAWDGKIRLFNVFGGEVYVGLLNYIIEFARHRDLTIDYPEKHHSYTIEQTEAMVNGLLPCVSGKPIQPYSYQISAVNHAINDGRALMVSPTSSGKSFMIYSLLQHYRNVINEKILIIVPTTSLVEQLYKDFKDYASELDPTFSEDNVHRIYSGKEKVTDKQIIITTWQSIYKLKKSFFDQFGCVIGDEAHNFKAKSLTSILTKMTNCKYKFGFTGTLDGTTTHKLVLEGLFGAVKSVISTKELMDSDTIAKLHIEAITLKYDEEERKFVKGMLYQEEINFLVGHVKRNKFICNLTLSRSKNTLVLFQFVEKHGKHLYNYLKKTDPNRPIFFVSGSTSVDERERIREITELSDNAIIVASYGTYSTGINIRNLHNIIFAHPSKSRIRNLQSVGRGLRKSEGKDVATLFDISDDLSMKKHKNFSLKHFIERIEIYNSEKFDFKLRSIKL